MTQIDERLMAKAAIIGLSSKPNEGYRGGQVSGTLDGHGLPRR